MIAVKERVGPNGSKLSLGNGGFVMIPSPLIINGSLMSNIGQMGQRISLRPDQHEN